MNLILSVRNILSKYHYKKFWMIFFLMLASMLVELIGIGAIFPIIQSILYKSDFSISFLQYKISYSASTWLIIFILIYFIKNLYLSFFNFYSCKFIHEIQTDLTSRLYIGYLNLPFLVIKNKNTSFFLRNIVSEVNTFSNATQSIILLTTELLIFLSILIFLFFIQPLITLVALIFYSFFGALVYFYFRNKNYNWGKIRQDSDQKKIKFIQETFEGISEIKIYNLEKFFYKKIFINLFNSSKMALLTSIPSFLPKYIFEFLTVIFFSILIIFMNYIELDKNQILTVLALLGISMFRILPCINKILSSSQYLRYTLPVIELIEGELENIKKNFLTEFSKFNKLVNSVEIDYSKIVLENLTFKYYDKNILENINFEIKKNQTIGFIGESGSGKSTLANIIAGLLAPDEGKIFIENNKGKKESLEIFKKRISYVPQNIFILEDSIKNNIILDNIFNEDRFNNILKMVNLHDYVIKLKEKENTLIGERGNNMSGGQKQRIGLARALYSNPKILILDESTNALDEKNERDIFTTLNTLKGKITMLIVTHKMNNLYFCDKIVTVKNKKIHYEI